jgi:hypothetical protein
MKKTCPWYFPPNDQSVRSSQIGKSIGHRSRELSTRRRSTRLEGRCVGSSIMFKLAHHPHVQESSPRCSLSPVRWENKLPSLNRGAAISGFVRNRINHAKEIKSIKYVNSTRLIVTIRVGESEDVLHATLTREIFGQELVESHVVRRFDRRLLQQRLFSFGTEFRQTLFIRRV